MPPRNLRDTTMAPSTRTLLRVALPQAGHDDYRSTIQLVESLMGRKPELRYQFITRRRASPRTSTSEPAFRSLRAPAKQRRSRQTVILPRPPR